MPSRPSPALPPDAERWVVMGRVGAPFGVHGWVRVQTFSTDPDALLDFDRWWLQEPAVGPRHASPPVQGPVEVLEAQAHGGGLIVHFAGVDDRDAATALRGCPVALPRDRLPPPEEGEFYWQDLIGLAAVDREGVTVGVVSGLIEAGAHDVLVIDRPQRDARGRARQWLVPFVERHVGTVDLAAGRVEVDWQEPV